jgi:hypothetical protein
MSNLRDHVEQRHGSRFQLVRSSYQQDIGRCPQPILDASVQLQMVARRCFSLGAELSIPRINRLLRPLRNKCAILASCTTSSSAAPVTITYGSTPSKLSRAPPSLHILRDPKLVISHAHLESKSLDALARQIYAVTGAYRNVVQAAFTNGLDGSHRGVLSLTDMCAATVGRNLQAEVVQGLAALDGETDEAVEMAISGELYESVPMNCRRYAARLYVTAPYEHKHLVPADGLSSHMRHPWSSTPAQIIRCSCLVFLVLRCPMVF